VATYAIGDLQGCFDEFEALLKAIDFVPSRDTLWLVGDLVNRGPKSLATLRGIAKLGGSVKVVLGNHDLHFLAVFYGGHDTRRSDTLDELLAAPDVEDLAAWLRNQPLIHTDSDLGWLMVHAGVPPLWSLAELIERAAEAHLTRMRLVAVDGTLDFANKGVPNEPPTGYLPWFSQERLGPLGINVAFGHWAALEGNTSVRGGKSAKGKQEQKHREEAGHLPTVAALDTGCVWGRKLTALCLETGKRTAVQAAAVS